MSADNGKEDREETSSCELSFKKEMDNRPFFFALASYFVFKAETWQTTPFSNNPDGTAAHNVVRQNPGLTRFARYQCSEISDTFTLFLQCFLQKIICQLTNHKRAIVYTSVVTYANQWVIKNLKVFLV